MVYAASLTAEDVEHITWSAGVRKSFSAFTEMTHQALLGRSPCLRFFVESQTEMKKRIDTEVLQRHKGVRQTSEEEGPHKIESEMGLHTSCASDSTMYLTIDYDVDFTRAIFPLPLRRVSATCSRTERQQQTEKDSTHQPNAEETSSELSDRQHLSDALQLIEVLHRENATLKKENTVLANLSRDKMKEMKELCRSLEDGAVAMAEVKKLKEKNVYLRMELETALEKLSTTTETLERLRRESGSGPTRRESSRVYRDRSGTKQTTPSSRRSSPLHTRSVNRTEEKGGGRRRGRFDTPPTTRPPSLSRLNQRRDDVLSSSTYERGGTRQVSRRAIPADADEDTISLGRWDGKERRPMNRTEGTQRPTSRRGTPTVSNYRLDSPTSSRCSSRSHERLYRQSTVSSRERFRASV